jgi:predicted membrane-bound spermidine synthase
LSVRLAAVLHAVVHTSALWSFTLSSTLSGGSVFAITYCISQLLVCTTHHVYSKLYAHANEAKGAVVAQQLLLSLLAHCCCQATGNYCSLNNSITSALIIKHACTIAVYF